MKNIFSCKFSQNSRYSLTTTYYTTTTTMSTTTTTTPLAPSLQRTTFSFMNMYCLIGLRRFLTNVCRGS